MTFSDEYNGHKNRETWLASLMLANESGLYTLAMEVAEDKLLSTIEVGEWLRQYAEDALIPDEDDVPGRAWQRDFIRTALARVEWQSVAEGFREASDDEGHRSEESEQ